ncbi:unnamed protein product [Acanthoscelides obtectus]|uniref:18S rRNA (pseudouridine-N1)-methyltransferase n=1 Tax=Acanthoscelides obtectus TaxID=200917 RepID=A0A9P0PEU9_ACAOB|nr:unnamed protein product [Acanthoscelides obtectus]CAK1653858.1 Ribosomal RNA small subunit methyltransferase NEP1 [Acanthoscelides obtectus]
MPKRKHDKKPGEEDFEFDPIPKHLVVAHLKNQEQRLIIILEGAQLQTCKRGTNYLLLNSDDFPKLTKNSQVGQDLRPDIVHQCLLMLFDSPLNRAGLLQVYIHTESNVLIEINPQTRVPRTFKRFAGLMVQLLHKFAVRAHDGPKLLKVIKNPITDHLPVGIRKIEMSFNCKNLKKPSEMVPKNEEPIAIVVGAIPRGSLNCDYTEETVSISNYPLSAALTCTKLCSAFEEAWNIF